jgi:hypothetical protein
MPIPVLLIPLFILFPLLLIWDVHRMRDPDTGEYKSRGLSDSLVLFAPFLVLFYHDNFWGVLVYYFVPLQLYCLLIVSGVQRWKKTDVLLEMSVVNGAGSLILTVIAYYLFFHEGALTQEPGPTPDVDTANVWSWWPFALIVLASWLTAILNSGKIVWVLAAAVLVVPFFSHHPLWAMSLASLAFMLVCFSLAQRQKNGAYVAFFFIYMLAQMGALIIYAVLF